MKTVDVLISNHNTDPVIELCVESVRARTDRPVHSIIVHDDSDEGGKDRAYLEGAEAKGWITLIRATTRERYAADKDNWGPEAHPAAYYHGAAINVMLETVKADYAMILDADVAIGQKSRHWLSRMVELMDSGTLVASHEWGSGWRESGSFVPGWCRPHFLLLNMAAYRDGMEVDWRGGSSRIDREPWKTLIASGYDGPRDTPVCNETVIFDPGSTLWAKLKVDNPKNYKSVNIPRDIELMYHHFNNASLRPLFPHEMTMLNKELTQIRRAA